MPRTDHKGGMQAQVRAAKAIAVVGIVPQVTPAASNASLGAAQEAHQNARGNFRATRAEAEGRLKVITGPNSVLVPWLAKHFRASILRAAPCHEPMCQRVCAVPEPPC